VEIYEVAIPAPWAGRVLSDLVSGDTGVAVAVTRAGRSLLPEPGFVLEPGDVVYLSATRAGMDTLRDRVAR
jgi:Trk K+ transport system NAD-binding subunit